MRGPETLVKICLDVPADATKTRPQLQDYNHVAPDRTAPTLWQSCCLANCLAGVLRETRKKPQNFELKPRDLKQRHACRVIPYVVIMQVVQDFVSKLGSTREHRAQNHVPGVCPLSSDEVKVHMDVRRDSIAVCPSPSLTPSNVSADLSCCPKLLPMLPTMLSPVASA